MRLGRTFYLDSSHHLPDYKGKCESVHGHTYRLDVVIEGEPGASGMVLDFADLARIVDENVIEPLDHKNLNTILDNPTAERITEWIWSALAAELPLAEVTLYEGREKWVTKTKP